MRIIEQLVDDFDQPIAMIVTTDGDKITETKEERWEKQIKNFERQFLQLAPGHLEKIIRDDSASAAAHLAAHRLLIKAGVQKSVQSGDTPISHL